MIQKYEGEYSFNKATVEGWNSTAIGVYYVGSRAANGSFASILYVGKATGDGGIRTRLLQHLSENKWPDATIFGYKVCSTAAEAEAHEAAEIKRLQPKYNVVGKAVWPAR